MITATLTDSDGVKISAEYDHDGHQDGPDLLVDLVGWVGGVSIRTNNVERLGHGSFKTKNYRTDRALTLMMMFERETRSELWNLERGISGLFADGGYGTLEISADDNPLFAEVRLDGEVKVDTFLDGGYLEAEIPLLAPDAHIYGEWREMNLQPADAGVGFDFVPFESGVITFGSAVSTDNYLVWNQGNAKSYPQFKIVANLPGGFAVGMGDKRVTYPWPTFADVPVIVDMRGEVLVNGVDQSYLLGERDWSYVERLSVETPFFEPLQGGNGFCVVSFRDTNL